jgi:hypothetical protein
VFGDLS